jgi:excisionase family DNA binding protein
VSTTVKVAFSLANAAAAVDCSTQHLVREIHAGRLPAKKVGREYRIDAAALHRWFEQLPDAESA